ncbi:hypothetical protein M413DRAFT_237454 [Hebeloma cylindrosporum]|uniref:Uncharacterized protein n=1 Tax=Hebeloma cylindrosporum TaxID=76867 RepID=A0A0C3C3E0_HEBCY|nr:hypothetical protein M413DRAFT_237454 [Hebeloma cylindrosporum h7]
MVRRSFDGSEVLLLEKKPLTPIQKMTWRLSASIVYRTAAPATMTTTTTTSFNFAPPLQCGPGRAGGSTLSLIHRKERRPHMWAARHRPFEAEDPLLEASCPMFRKLSKYPVQATSHVQAIASLALTTPPFEVPGSAVNERH